MKFTLKSMYKSVRHLPANELPDFTVMTGINGSGKTHFLQAVANEQIAVDGISRHVIEYYDWTTLAPADEEASPRDIEHKRNELWKQTHAYISEEKSGFATKIQKLGIPKLGAMSAAALARLGEHELVEITGDADVAKACLAKVSLYLQKASDRVRQHTGDEHFLRRIWSKIEKDAEVPLIAISENEFFAHCPLVVEETNPFHGRIAQLFASYVSALETNDFNRYRTEKLGTPLPFLSEKEFQLRYGPPPWKTLNDIFAAADLDIRIKEPCLDGSRDYVPRLFDRFEETERRASELSSGERVLVSFASYLFFSRDGRQPARFPELLLLDEVDAPLHPSMALSLLRIIERVIVGEFGRRVIMSTHSASTVALAPEDSIYVMDKESRTLRKSSKDQAIRTLTAGVPVLSISIEHRRQVFVEGKSDVVAYEKLQRLLQPILESDISLVFIQTGTKKDGGCDRVKEFVHGLHANGVRTVFGIIDWDGKNVPGDHILVLGKDKRHSIENYILDPVIVAAFLLREKLVQKSEFGLTAAQPFTDLRDFDDKQLQAVVDSTLRLMSWPDSGDHRVECEYSSGRRVFIPQSLLQKRGHDIESDLKSVFPALNKFRNETDLTLEVVHKVLDDFSGFVPKDVEDLFKAIQAS